MNGRIRIRSPKLGKLRWISHRDVAPAWERAFRRVELPLAYSVGFSPRPKVSFGLALPTGYESVAEYLDVETVDADLDVDALPARLSAALPDGLDVLAAAWVDPRTPSLQEDVESCTWRWEAVGASSAQAELHERVKRLVDSSTAVVTRSRKGQPVTEDVRAGILDLRVAGADGAWVEAESGVAGPERLGGVAAESGVVGADRAWLEAELACKPRGLRPTDVMAALNLAWGGPGAVEGWGGPGAVEGRGGSGAVEGWGGSGASPGRLEERDVRRLNQWMWRNGARLEPLMAEGSAGATGAPHAVERAS